MTRRELSHYCLCSGEDGPCRRQSRLVSGPLVDCQRLLSRCCQTIKNVIIEHVVMIHNLGRRGVSDGT